MPDDAAALRMTHLLKMAQDNNSSHVAVLDMLVEQLSNVQQQLVIQTIVMKKYFSCLVINFINPFIKHFRG